MKFEAPEISNAVIAYASFIVDENMHSFYISFDYESGSQILHTSNMRSVASFMKLMSVNDLAYLKGKACRVEHTFNKILKLGHIIKDEWVVFNPLTDE